jgi:hypothetical protein
MHSYLDALKMLASGSAPSADHLAGCSAEQLRVLFVAHEVFSAQVKAEPRIRYEGDSAALLDAIAKARGMFGPMIKNKTVKIIGKATYEYTYMTMGEITGATTNALADNGIACSLLFSRAQDLRSAYCEFVLAGHGGRIVSTSTLPTVSEGVDRDGNPYSEPMEEKDFAGLLTYHQRYSFSKAFNLPVDGDADDAPRPSERGATAETRPTPKAAARPAAPTDEQLDELASLAKVLMLSAEDKASWCKRITGLPTGQLTADGARQLTAALQTELAKRVSTETGGQS